MKGNSSFLVNAGIGYRKDGKPPSSASISLIATTTTLSTTTPADSPAKTPSSQRHPPAPHRAAQCPPACDIQVLNMIHEPKTNSAYLISAWSAGIALLCLGIGLHGATAPLIPAPDALIQSCISEDIVMVENFQLPAAAAAAEESPPEPETKEEDIEIPPLPQITPPLTPPEMVEITPLEEALPAPMPKPVEKKPSCQACHCSEARTSPGEQA